jgi:hypothetical protein
MPVGTGEAATAGPGQAVTPGDREASLEALHALAARLGEGFSIKYAETPHKKLPYLHVANRLATFMHDNIYAGSGSYWLGSLQVPIWPIGDAAGAAGRVMHILGARDG